MNQDFYKMSFIRFILHKLVDALFSMFVTVIVGGLAIKLIYDDFNFMSEETITYIIIGIGVFYFLLYSIIYNNVSKVNVNADGVTFYYFLSGHNETIAFDDYYINSEVTTIRYNGIPARHKKRVNIFNLINPSEYAEKTYNLDAFSVSSFNNLFHAIDTIQNKKLYEEELKSETDVSNSYNNFNLYLPKKKFSVTKTSTNSSIETIIAVIIGSAIIVGIAYLYTVMLESGVKELHAQLTLLGGFALLVILGFIRRLGSRGLNLKFEPTAFWFKNDEYKYAHIEKMIWNCTDSDKGIGQLRIYLKNGQKPFYLTFFKKYKDDDGEQIYLSNIFKDICMKHNIQFIDKRI